MRRTSMSLSGNPYNRHNKIFPARMSILIPIRSALILNTSAMWNLVTLELRSRYYSGPFDKSRSIGIFENACFIYVYLFGQTSINTSTNLIRNRKVEGSIPFTGSTRSESAFDQCAESQ